MTQDTDALKRAVGIYALKYINKDGMRIGVGTGSTVKYFIDALSTLKDRIDCCVSSSEQSTALLKQYNIPVMDLNSIAEIDIYIDGADEINHNLQMNKGGGGALTREKIIAAVAPKFICIADYTKYVHLLGTKHPLIIEVIPMARSYVAREMFKLGGVPVWQNDVVTDNGNYLLEVHYHSPILNPPELEMQINNITGVVSNGLFAIRTADELVLGTSNGAIDVIKKAESGR